jgi:hypothetical protein
MAIDKNLRMSHQQAVTNNQTSTYAIAMSAVRNIGVGRTPYVIVQVDGEQMADTGNNSNCTVYFQTDALAAMNSATNTRTLGVFATNSAIGTKIGPIALSPGEANEEFGGIYYSMGGGDLSGGKFTAYITFDPDLKGAYPDAITVSVP